MATVQRFYQLLESLYGGQFTLSTPLIKPNFCILLPHRRSTTVSLETTPSFILQILTVLCCIHRHIHHMSRTPFLILNFLDFHVYVVMTPIFPANQRRCASFSKNVAILSLRSKRATIVPNNLIDSHHYKRHKKIRMTEFHSPSLSILIITQSKVSFLITLNYSKMIPRLEEPFRNLQNFIRTRQKRRQLFSLITNVLLFFTLPCYHQ